MNGFKLGDRVFWKSQAAGYEIAKVGVVIFRLDSGADPISANRKLSEKHNAKSNYGGGGPRKHESYFVLVEEKTKSGAPKKPSLYWPRVSSLKIS